MRTIILTGAGGAAASNFIRALRMSDTEHSVVGCDIRPHNLALADLQRRYLVPRCDTPAYLKRLAEIASEENAALVHPQPDAEVSRLAAAAESLPFATALPPAQVVDLCHDKLECARAFAEAGVPVPGFAQLTSADQFTRLQSELGGGVVWIRAIRGAGSRAALPVDTELQVRGWLDYWQRRRGLPPEDFMVSEYLPGREFAFQSIWWNGELVVSAARERVEYLFGSLTPSGQTSTPSLARSVHDDRVNQTAVKAVRAVAGRPHGVMCVDMKEDASGQPRVTEINCGRFFTTSDFFAAAGCNMPDIYLSLALGETTAEQVRQRHPALNAVPADLWWVRNIDAVGQLLREGEWQERLS